MNIAPVHPLPTSGNTGIVPPWLLPSPVVPLPGPVDDDFVILPVPGPGDIPVALTGISLLG